MFVILGGLGIQGRAILHYLLSEYNMKVVVFDRAVEIPEDLKLKYNHHIKNGMLEYRHDEWRRADLKQYADNIVVISCLPTEYNLDVTGSCILNGYSMVDLGGVTSVVRDQFALDKSAFNSGITVVPDCGLAPGIVSSLASLYQNEGWTSVEIFCGGIPKVPEPPLSYAKMFYPAGVVKEFSGIAQEILNGKLINVPARSNKELLFVPGFGVLEAVVTSGGVSITPEHLKLDKFSYKTLRYPGHLDYLEKYILSQPDPAGVLDGILEDVGDDNPDVIILCARLKNEKGYAFTEFFWEYDPKSGLSAMSQATGYTVASVATMVHEGLIRSGVVGMHEIDAKEIVARAQLMPDQFSEFPPTF